MKKLNLTELEEKISKEIDKDSFFEAFSKESDRAVGIISVCYLDDLLEKLIRASYIDNKQVSALFKDEHVLRSFYAKINIAYFSGLLPTMVYHDLQIISGIRNRFAHEVIANLRFADETITKRVDKLVQLPHDVADVYSPRLKYLLIVTHIGSLLRILRELLSLTKQPNLVEMFNFDKMPFKEMILKPSQVRDIINKERGKEKHKD